MRRLIILAFVLIASTQANAQKTIDQLSAGITITGTELIPMFQGSNPAVTTTPNALKTYIGGGTVTSVATGCQATGGTITTTGTISTQEKWFSLSGNAIVTGDCGGTVDVSGSSDTAPTIAEAGTTGFPAWWYGDVCSAGTHSQTLTPGAGTIGGASTYVLASGTATAPSCIRLTSDGVSNYKLSFPPGSGATGANPSATAGPSANNGSAPTFMRSDASPAVQVGSASQEGIVEVDGSTIKAAAGVISAYAGIPASYVSGNYYAFQGQGGTVAAGNALIANTLFCTFGGVQPNVTIKALFGDITTGSAANHIQYGIYSVVGNTATLVDSTPSVSTTSTGAATGTVANTTDVLSAGVLYMTCANSDSTPTLVQPSTASPLSFSQGALIGSTTAVNVIAGTGLVGKTLSETFGTWPGTITISTMSDNNVSRGATIGFQVN